MKIENAPQTNHNIKLSEEKYYETDFWAFRNA